MLHLNTNIARTFFVLIALSTAAAEIASGRSAQPTERVNREPLFGKADLVLKESLFIGPGSSESELRNIIGLYLDAGDSLYVVESKRVSKWNASGRYLGNIGALGQGPGEFMTATGLFIHEDGRLFLNDQGRALVVYSKDGSFLRRVSLSEHLFSSNFFVDRQENIYGLTMFMTRTQLAKLNPDGRLISTLAGAPPIEMSGVVASGIAGGLLHALSPANHMCRTPEGVCFGSNLEYSLRIYDLEGKLLRCFSKEEKPQDISKDIEAAEAAWGRDYIRKYNVTFPEHRPFFQGLLSDEHGRIYVLRTRPLLSKDKRQEVDIFDKCGNFLYRAVLPYRPSIIRNGVMFAVDQDDDGWFLVRKVEIKNANGLRISAAGCK